MVGEVGVEPTRIIHPWDFKSHVSAIPPLARLHFQLRRINPPLNFQLITDSSMLLLEAASGIEPLNNGFVPQKIHHYLEARTGIAPVYAVLQTAA